MDENMGRGYCQLGAETPGVECRSFPGNDNTASAAPPKDRYSLIYLALVLCGAGFLLPYNSFITAVDYYQAKYPQSTIIFDMSLVYICVAFVGVVLNNLLVEQFSLFTRITCGYILSFVMLLLVSLCDVWYDVFEKDTSYIVNLVAVATVAFGCTVQQSSFYGYTSMLPRRYTQAVMTGESAAGLLVSVNRILTKALLDNSRVNTIIFFAVSIASVAICFVAFNVTRATQFARFYVSRCESARVGDDQRGITAQDVNNPEEVSLVDILDGNTSRDSYGVLVIRTPTTPTEDKSFPQYVQQQEQNSVYSTTSASALTQQNEAQVQYQGQAYRKYIPIVASLKRGCRIRYEVSRHVWPYMLSIALAYFVTLCLFPGIETEVVSCRLHSWMPVILITLMNLFDFIGKIFASIPYDWPRSRLVFCSLCRIVLVPLLMLCAAPRRAPFLQHEAWSMLLSALLGITNGYFGSVPMIIAPGKVPDDMKEMTGNIMTLSYSLGLTSGSVCAYLLDAWLGPHLPGDPCLPGNGTLAQWANATNFLDILSHLSEVPGI